MFASFSIPHPSASPSSLPTHSLGSHPHHCCAQWTWRTPPNVTIQTHPGGPTALVLQVLPCAWGQGLWGWRWLWEQVPKSSTQGWWSCWTLGSAKPIQTSCGDATTGFRGHRTVSLPDTWLPSSNSRNNLGQKERAYWRLFGALCSKSNLFLNVKFFYNWLPIGMTKGDSGDILGTALCLSCSLVNALFSTLWSLIFFLGLEGFYLCP